MVQRLRGLRCLCGGCWSTLRHSRVASEGWPVCSGSLGSAASGWVKHLCGISVYHYEVPVNVGSFSFPVCTHWLKSRTFIAKQRMVIWFYRLCPEHFWLGLFQVLQSGTKSMNPEYFATWGHLDLTRHQNYGPQCFFGTIKPACLLWIGLAAMVEMRLASRSARMPVYANVCSRMPMYACVCISVYHCVSTYIIYMIMNLSAHS